MQSNSWNDFYQSGRVSDYLKYIDSVKNSVWDDGEYLKKDNMSVGMETVRYADQGDRDGAFGHTSW